MIRGIHYFSTELKTKIDVIPRGCFNVTKSKLCEMWINSVLAVQTFPRILASIFLGAWFSFIACIYTF